MFTHAHARQGIQDMDVVKKTYVAAIALLVGTLPAEAVPLLCEDASRNHMFVDTSLVSSCVDAGMGNVNGNPLTDDFLIANPSLDYEGIGSGLFTQSGNTGTFSFDSALWNLWDSIAVGFKFGTGRYADQWFVYLLNNSVSSGAWEFVNVGGTGGGLSHIQLYGVEPTSVPEPATLALLSVGLFGIGLARRKRNAKA
jgi:hypothetical protein